MEGWRELTRKRPATRQRTDSSAWPSRQGRRQRRRLAEPAKVLDDWFSGENRSNPLSNMVLISATDFQQLWGPSQTATVEIAKEAMRKVHDAMQKLRACYTDVAVEKACLEVAVLLLDLVAKKCCENPFLCLQQAAIFASQGTKLGHSDAFFRGPLPDKSACTPEDALVIIGRADCFQSVYFPYEAAFLCNYVAQVCSIHRDDESESSEDQTSSWNDKWKIVSILCYNLSVMIRTTIGQVLASKTKKEEFDPWDNDVIDELMRGRADALAWKSSSPSLLVHTDAVTRKQAPPLYNGTNAATDSQRVSTVTSPVKIPQKNMNEEDDVVNKENWTDAAASHHQGNSRNIDDKNLASHHEMVYPSLASLNSDGLSSLVDRPAAFDTEASGGDVDADDTMQTANEAPDHGCVDLGDVDVVAV
jgi:hypothetical protein